MQLSTGATNPMKEKTTMKMKTVTNLRFIRWTDSPIAERQTTSDRCRYCGSIRSSHEAPSFGEIVVNTICAITLLTLVGSVLYLADHWAHAQVYQIVEYRSFDEIWNPCPCGTLCATYVRTSAFSLEKTSQPSHHSSHDSDPSAPIWSRHQYNSSMAWPCFA